MQYRTDRYGNKISVLGFGCMRFTKKGSKIDFDKAEREIMAAYRRGVNYYDTAYVYPGSEALIGEIFEKNNIRDKINIATKLPHYLIRKKEDPEKFFEEELKRLRTDHVDYYLMHMLTDAATWERLIGLGIKEWIDEKKKNGQIKQVGFSYHGGTEGFIKLIDAYDWDFCQIQYNYMDENAQAGVRGLKYAAAKGIPVVIMEPLRGGKLVNIPKRAKKLLEKYPVKRSPAEWAFRWLWNQPEVTCVLSGMNSVKMVKENCATASDAKVGELTERDMKLYKKVLAIINIKMKVGCTGCGYCMPCPKGVDIPGTFSSYNMCASEGYISSLRDHL
ncbi:MAG: aldo/keto reductase, partial [Lachnospiraceae bacterium]|nr:aldo/keto reductase [Lachnospiraceae bacterium]